MAGFSFHETELDGAYLVSDFYSGDNRGGFTKTFERDIYLEAGISFNLNETFVSRSMKNVIRGLHFQTNNPQAKLVSVLNGRVWDVIVDLRPYSKTYKKWAGCELSAENHLSFFAPRGFAHGFVSLEDNTIMLYQCDGKYDKETDTGIIFNDPDIGVEWPVDEKYAIHSKRDLKLGSFSDYLKHPMKLCRGAMSRLFVYLITALEIYGREQHEREHDNSPIRCYRISWWQCGGFSQSNGI